MKKIIINTLLGLTFTHFATAQNKFFIGANTGIGATTITSTPIPGVTAGVAAGLSADYSVSNHYSLGMRLRYSQEGENGFIAPNDVSTTCRSQLNYVRLPLVVSYLFKDSTKRLRPNVFAGPSFGLLVGGNTTISKINKNPDVMESKTLHKSFDFGITAGAGLNYELNKSILLNTELSFLQGLYNIKKESKGFNSNVMLSAGIKWSPKRKNSDSKSSEKKNLNNAG